MTQEEREERLVESWELFEEDEGPVARRATATGTWVTGASLLMLLAIFALWMHFSNSPRWAAGLPKGPVYLAIGFAATFVGVVLIGYVLRKPNLCAIAAIPLIFAGVMLAGEERDEMGRRIPQEKRPRMAVSEAAAWAAVLPMGGLALGFVLGGMEQRLLWRRADDHVLWHLNWGLGTVRKEWRHAELRSFRFEDHLIEYRTKNGTQKMIFGKLFLTTQGGEDTELVSSGDLLATRRAAEALAEHFGIRWMNRVIRDGKIQRSIESGDDA